MKIYTSEIDKIKLDERQITKILFSSDEPQAVDCIMVLGGYQHARADRAAEFYWRGLAKTIAVTGGITGSQVYSISQGRFLANYLIEQGIPEKDIIIEGHSTNTLENIMFGIEEIRNRLGQNKRLGFISIPYHMLRVKLAAIKLGIDFALYYPDTRSYIKDIWSYSPFWKNKVMEEVKKIGTYCRKGDITDIQIDI